MPARCVGDQYALLHGRVDADTRDVGQWHNLTVRPTLPQTTSAATPE